MPDFFDEILSPEEDYYEEGYASGLADGEKAGRTEGRIFGLERGFQKFLNLGRLQGRCSVWNTRTSSVSSTVPPDNVRITNPRVQKNIGALALLLTNPPFKNDEESVEEVEETLKRGKAKVKVLERMLGEKEETRNDATEENGEQNIEDLGKGMRTISDL